MVEVVCCSAADAVGAQAAGAGRIELCYNIAVGGLTPAPGLLKEVKAITELPVVAMVRPRAGDFCYSDGEFATMIEHAKVLADEGADGLVFGILDQNSRIDMDRCRTLRQKFTQLPCIFHKAFDALPDQKAGLEELIELQFDRVLTSGGKESALEGSAQLIQLRDEASERIEILPAGRIRSEAATQFKSIGFKSIHCGPFQEGRLDQTAVSNIVRSYGL